MHDATYNLHDDRLKLFLDLSDRIPRDEYQALRGLGLVWWRGSKCLTGVWTPEREDAVLRYADIEFIVDDDCGLDYRLERFGEYAVNAQARVDTEEARIQQLTEHIPLGQPILVGHHSEKHAHRVQRLLYGAMQRKVWESKRADYWAHRQERAERHAAYKERPDVILRRIERYEADLRRWRRQMSDEEKIEWAVTHPNRDWEDHVQYCRRWVDHLEMVLDYQRELYERSGGVPFDRGEVILEVGGAIKSLSDCWVPIIRVNPKSVTVLNTYRYWEGPISHVFTRTVKKTEITRALAAEEYRRHEHYTIGQALIAAHEQMSRPDLQVKKGGAVRISYAHMGGGMTDWMYVVRVNKKTLTVLRWSPYSGGVWRKDRVARRDVSEVMTAEQFAAFQEEEHAEDGRWEKLSQATG